MLKIVVLGDDDQEKINFIRSIIPPSSPIEYISKLGADIYFSPYLQNDPYLENPLEKTGVMFWIITGNPAYSPLIKSYIEGASGIIICLNRASSYLMNQIAKWNAFSSFGRSNAKIFIVTAKDDENTGILPEDLIDMREIQKQKMIVVSHDITQNQDDIFKYLLENIPKDHIKNETAKESLYA